MHFEADPGAAVRMTRTGRATVLNASRADVTAVAAAVALLGDDVHDWRTPPPELSEQEWAVLYERFDDLTPQKIKRRTASAAETLGADGFAPWRLPRPTDE